VNQVPPGDLYEKLSNVGGINNVEGTNNVGGGTIRRPYSNSHIPFFNGFSKDLNVVNPMWEVVPSGDLGEYRKS